MIYIIDNGGCYSDHAIYFVKSASLDMVEKIAKAKSAAERDEPFSDPDREWKVLGAASEWWGPKPISLAEWAEQWPEVEFRDGKWRAVE